MKSKKINLFKIKYQWVEGEYGEALLGKNVEREGFERDLIKARKFSQDLLGKIIRKGNYLGRGYRVECLPEFYEQIVWFMVNKLGYTECHLENITEYEIDDWGDPSKILLRKISEKTEIIELNPDDFSK